MTRRYIRRFQHTAARRRLLDIERQPPEDKKGFNTQPPEGGCPWIDPTKEAQAWFQHTAARRRLPKEVDEQTKRISVSTHSRPKAAAACFLY